VPATLFLGLALVYLVGVVGIVVVDSYVGERDEAPVGLDERLAMIRATEARAKRRAALAPAAATPYYVRVGRKH
jgi:hypothetical protein